MPVTIESTSATYTTFDGHRRIATGSLQSNALATKRALESNATGPVLIFEDATGRAIDVDLRGDEEAVLTRLDYEAAAAAARTGSPEQPDGPPGRGRPKLGVVAREVTLLPRHWDWLATQPGGASVALRKLVDDARRTNSEKDKTRQAQERAYNFMVAVAGNLPHFEEASRALFANDREKLGELIAGWPEDVRQHAFRLAFE